MRTHVLCTLLVLLASAFFLWVEHEGGVEKGLPIDDAWIQAAYAKNLREGRIAVLHEGQPAAQGSTAPLWVLLLGGAQAVAAPFASERETAVHAARALGILCAILALATFRRLLARFAVQTSLAWLVLAFLAFSGRFAWGWLSGLEVPLYTLLVLLALERHIACKGTGTRSHLALPFAALAGWSRPECFVLPFLLVLDTWLLPGRNANGARAPRLPSPRAIAGTAAILLGYVLLHLWVHGRPPPTTFYVKAEVDSPLTALADSRFVDALTSGILMGLKQLQSNWVFFTGMLLPLIVWLPAGWRRASYSPERKGTILWLYVLAFPLVQGAVHFVQPENQVGRYFFHLHPPLLLLAALGAQELLVGRGGALRANRSATSASWALLVPLPILLGVWFQHGSAPLLETMSYVYWNRTGELAASSPQWYWLTGAALASLHLALLLLGVLARPASAPPRQRALWFAFPAIAMVLFTGSSFVSVANVFAKNVEQTNAVNVASATWVREHTDPRDEIACHDLGALAYFADRALIDLQGIGSIEVLDVERGPDGRRALAPFLLARKPRFYVGFPDWHARDLTGAMLLANATRTLGAFQRSLGWEPLPQPTSLVPLPRQAFPEIPLQRNVTVGGNQMFAVELLWGTTRSP